MDKIESSQSHPSETRNKTALVKKFGVKVEPVVFHIRDARSYASRILPDAQLENHRDICIRKAAEMISPNLTGKNVIDIGCGEGRWSRFAATRGAIVLGVDESKEMIQIASERNKAFGKISLEPLTIHELRRFQNQFDLAIASYVFHNITNLDLAFQITEEIMKEGGELIIITKTFPLSKLNLEALKGLFLPVKINNRYMMYTVAQSFDDFIESGSKHNFVLIDDFSQVSHDKFANKNLEKIKLQIEDRVMMYRLIKSQEKNRRLHITSL